jgi:hypothetical protein
MPLTSKPMQKALAAVENMTADNDCLTGQN